MSKPTILFVPGAWHTPEIYDGVITRLQADGYPTVAIPLPSCGADPPHTSFDKDVQGIRDALIQLVEKEHKDVVCVFHSYTGMPGTEAPEGLGRKERADKDLPGGVVRLVYVSAFAMPEGFQPTANGAQYPEWMKIDAERGIVTVEPEDAKQIFYHDIRDPKLVDEWAGKVQTQSLGVYTSTTKYAAWRYIPSSFVAGKKDRSHFNLDLVNFMIETAKKQEPTAFDTVEYCEEGGHCLMISHPEWLSNVLKQAATPASD